MLGWRINTRTLQLSLPRNKFIAWTKDLEVILQSDCRKIPHKQIESLLGRSQHVASVLSPAAHFLSKIHRAERRAFYAGATQFTRDELADCVLWRKILRHSHNRVDINTLVFRSPNNISMSDACEYQLGGFSLWTGQAWRWPIPSPWIGRHSINFLEFVACATGILLLLFENKIQAGDCVLSIADNTSAVGWLRKTNFDPKGTS